MDSGEIMNDLLLGVDIGGTKCAVVLGNSVPEVFLTELNSQQIQKQDRIML